MAYLVKFAGKPIVTFYVNDSRPLRMAIGDIIWFHADGDELNAIRAQFTNLPMTKGNFCRWTGELAEFIFVNLQL